MHEEINMLCEKWKTLHSQLLHAKAPMKLLSELDKATSIIRDLLNTSFTKIVVNDRDIYEGIKMYLENNLPEKLKLFNYTKGVNPYLIITE